MVFSVHNNLKATISVQSLTTALDTTNYPAPPADCTGTNLELPTFSGSFNVSGGGNNTSPGVPVELKDNGAPQDDCENYTYHFVYSGSASYTEVYGTSTGLGSSQNPSTVGQSVTYTATVTASATSSQDPVPSSPTGTVTFKDNGTTICNAVPVTSTGTTTATAPCTVTYATTAGSPHPITASYVNTDGNFNGSTSGTLSQVVTSSTLGTTSVLTSAPNPSSYGSSVTFTDTVSASTGTPGGTVTFYSCTTNTCSTKTSLGTETLSSGKAPYSTSTLPVGTTYVEAVYSASGNYGGSTSNVVSQVVNALGTTSVLTSSANPSAYGTSVTFTDTVSASSGTPSGTVTFYSCTTSACSTKSSLGTGTLSAGKVTYATSSLPAGTTYVEAVYSASGNYGGSTSNVVSQVVNALGTTSVLTSSPNPSAYGTSVTFTDTVSASSGTPTGSVTFYTCTTSACTTKTSLGTGTLSAGKVTYATSSLPAGTTYVEAVYSATGNYGGSTSNVVSQVVNALGTTSVLASSPNPSTYGSSVTFTDTVSASSGTPGGTVTFYSCSTNTCSTKTSLGTETLSAGKATYSTSSLPAGTTYVEAVYGASGNYGGSTSNVVTQVVLNVPNACAAGGYSDIVTGTPADPFVHGTNGNDLIYAFGASYWINGFAGNDCVDAGDGNNLIFDGNGNDGVSAGNGSNTVILGNGNDKVSLGNGSDGVETGDGTDTVTLGNGSDSEVIVGNGNDNVTVGTGSYNHVELGSGTDTVTIQGSHDDINGGNGNETVYLGSGTYNSYSGQAHRTNVCHLPKPPSSYHGTTAAYYDDTVNNCTVVSP
jgi:hypothetical protein